MLSRYLSRGESARAPLAQGGQQHVGARGRGTAREQRGEWHEPLGRPLAEAKRAYLRHKVRGESGVEGEGRASRANRSRLAGGSGGLSPRPLPTAAPVPVLWRLEEEAGGRVGGWGGASAALGVAEAPLAARAVSHLFLHSHVTLHKCPPAVAARAGGGAVGAAAGGGGRVEERLERLLEACRRVARAEQRAEHG